MRWRPMPQTRTLGKRWPGGILYDMMTSTDRERIIQVARRAALEGRALEDAVESSVVELAPVLSRGVQALELIRLAEEEYDWMTGVLRRQAGRGATPWHSDRAP